jgi:exosortase
MTSKVMALVPPKQRPVAVVLAVFAVALLWGYWPTLGELARRWSNDPQYSHGYLVPAFALVLLWLRRQQLLTVTFGFRWWGLPLCIGGALLRFVGTYYYFDWIDAASLLPFLAGVAVLLGGKQALRWSWPAIAFLAFMIPLPFRLEVAAAVPLRRLATQISTYTLQTIGLPAISEGNVIILEDVRIGVVEACSGLSMLVIFFALSTAMTFVIERVWWEKLLLVFSAVPIAVIANVIRITVTGILHETAGSEVANAVFHDLAGWFMMPLALGMLWLELKVLSHLLVYPKPPARLPIGVGSQPRLAGPAPETKPRKQRKPRKKRNEKPNIPLLPNN